MDRYQHLGKGFGYPFTFNNGVVDKAEYLDSIRASIQLILDTRPGEIFMMPHIGCRLWELVFFSVDEVFYSLAQQYITQAIYDQEPRIDNLTLTFHEDEDSPNKVTIVLAYDVINTSYEDSHTYEFETKGA